MSSQLSRSTVVGGLRDDVSTFNDDGIGFSDGPETVQAVQAGRRRPRLQLPRGSGRGPWQPASAPGPVPLARLSGLVAIVIAIVVASVSWIGACQGASKQGEYAGYLSGVRLVALRSSQLGAQFAGTLLSPGPKITALAARVQGYAEQQQLAYEQAQQIRVPAALRPAHQQLLNALELRTKGLANLSQTLALPAAGTAGSSRLTVLLTAQAQLLTTSDIVWTQLYRAAATEQIKAQHVFGLEVPGSHFITNTDLVSARSFGLLLQRVRGVSTRSVPAKLLKPGDSGAAVAAWQVQLNRWLKKAQPQQALLTPTRVFDAATVAATKTLQAAASITADGIVGPATRQALRRLLANRG
jgi:peptidoglycan hydrolase-like protein with peptidoglycan-binding domain